MLAVYLDSQIFRNLKNRDSLDEKYKKLYSRLNEYISNNLNNFLFFYSHAHLLDLKGDLTEKKYSDLEYMSTIVGDNYILLEFKSQTAKYLLVNPKNAFKLMQEDDDVDPLNFSELFNPETYKDSIPKEQYESLKENVSYLETFRVADAFPGLEDLPDDIKKAISDFLPIDNPEANFIDLLNHFKDFSKKFQEHDEVYKGLRKLVNGNSKYKIALNTFDLTESYAGTEIQSNFIDYIKGKINNQNHTTFDLHYNAYFHLDILGIQQEKSKKLKTGNMLVDGHHSYYGAHCDIFVSDDIQLREKSKIIYKLLEIDTRVLSVEEFITEMFNLELDLDINESKFIEKITNKLETSFIKRITYPVPERQIVHFNSEHYFLNYFNEVRFIKDDAKSYIVFRHMIRNYFGNMTPFKTIQEVIKKTLSLFGVDDDFKGEYSFDKEDQEIKKNDWPGRIWTRKNLQIILEFNSTTKIFNMVIHNPNL